MKFCIISSVLSSEYSISSEIIRASVIAFFSPSESDFKSEAKSLAAIPERMRDCATLPVEAFSAGLFAREGDPIAENAVKALKAAGVAPVAAHDYRTHTAHTLTDAMATEYDLLVGMSGGHVIELMMRYPHLAGRIVCMPSPISDPFGGDEACYRACLSEIEAGVKKLLFEEGL